MKSKSHTGIIIYILEVLHKLDLYLPTFIEKSKVFVIINHKMLPDIKNLIEKIYL